MLGHFFVKVFHLPYETAYCIRERFPGATVADTEQMIAGHRPGFLSLGVAKQPEMRPAHRTQSSSLNFFAAQIPLRHNGSKEMLRRFVVYQDSRVRLQGDLAIPTEDLPADRGHGHSGRLLQGCKRSAIKDCCGELV